MSLGDKMFKGLAWSAIERLSIQSIQFVIQIALARILTPEEYGTIGILYVFIAISTVFIDSGFTKALIQKKDRTENDISTVFIFNLSLSFIIYLLLFVTAPFVSEFYNKIELTLLLRVLALTLIINAFIAVPITLYTIKLDFKSLTKINFIAAIVSGVVGYIMALKGYGVWALIGLTVSRSILTAILAWIFLKWRPNWVFSKSSFKQLFSFGSNLLISSLLNVGVNKSYELVIPKVSSVQDLGYYTRGTQFTDALFNIITTIFNRVLLPGLTDLQDQIKTLVNTTRKIIRSAAAIVIPLFFLLAVIAEPIIRYLLTDKWLPAVPIMQLFCFARLITIISGININLLYVLGRSDLALRQQYIKLTVRAVFLIIALNYGIIYIAIAELISTIVHFFINCYYPGKIMKYGALKQIRDILPIIVSSLIMSLAVYLTLKPFNDDLLKLVFAVIVAIPTYLILLNLFKVEEIKSITSKATYLFKERYQK